MTAFICEQCGLWIGTEYTGNHNYLTHVCEPDIIKAVIKGKKELVKLDEDYWKKRYEIENKIITPI